jgi:hypothetical protein
MAAMEIGNAIRFNMRSPSEYASYLNPGTDRPAFHA